MYCYGRMRAVGKVCCVTPESGVIILLCVGGYVVLHLNKELLFYYVREDMLCYAWPRFGMTMWRAVFQRS